MAITDRSDENRRRKGRLAQIKKGPGVFMYDGEFEDHESTPTPLRTGKKEPLFDGAGLPVTDSDGNQRFEKPGKIVIDPATGQPKLGGTPKVVRQALESITIRGVEFPAGKPVEVKDSGLALKLRCMSHFEELEAIRVEEEPEGGEGAPVPKKRGRPAKTKPEEPEGGEG